MNTITPTTAILSSGRARCTDCILDILHLLRYGAQSMYARYISFALRRIAYKLSQVWKLLTIDWRLATGGYHL